MWPFLCACIAVALVTAVHDAGAQPVNLRAYPVNVVAVDSDDAEDQADALSTALRSRIRATPGWALTDTTTSLSTLTAALRCPRAPDGPCLARIAEQLKTDRFIWGTMTRAPGNQVAVELHLYTKGKPDTAAKETYSDNLKDQNDEVLRRLAQRLFERLTGAVGTGMLSVHAGTGGGSLSVDGQQRVLEKGDASLELPPGVHTVEVSVPGFKPAKELVTIFAGKDTKISVPLAPEEARVEAALKPTPVRKIVGFGVIAAGAGLMIVGGIEGLQYRSLDNAQQRSLAAVERSKGDACAQTSPAAIDACDRYHKGLRVSTAAWLFTGVGVAAVATGIILLMTDKGEAPHADDRGRSRLRVVPELGAGGGGLRVVGTF